MKPLVRNRRPPWSVGGRTLYPVALALGLLATSAAAAPDPIDPAAAQRIREQLMALDPGMGVQNIERSDLPGFYAVDVAGGILYVDATATYVIPGSVYRIDAQGVVDLGEKRLAKRRLELLATVALDEMIVFPATTRTQAVISVFTDIDCGYCRKLHRDVPTLNAMGVEVRYLAYPRAGIGSESYDKAVTAWCSKDRRTALTELKLGRTVRPLKCAAPVAAQYELGRRIGIAGTPALVLADGSMIPGYLSAEELGRRLGVVGS